MSRYVLDNLLIHSHAILKFIQFNHAKKGLSFLFYHNNLGEVSEK